MKLLNEIQQKLKAPKGQYNKFGKYNYRSLEDICEAVKPLLGDGTLTFSDELVEIAGRAYIKSTATLKHKEETSSATGFAKESNKNKNGMDDPQETGSASSYARKYAANGLFLIDDTKDSDSTNTHGKEDIKKKPMTDIAKAVEALASAPEKQKLFNKIVSQYDLTEVQKTALENEL